MDMTAEERISWLEDQLKQALTHVQELQEQLAVAQLRIEELEKQKTPPPAFVKANKKKAPEEAKKAPHAAGCSGYGSPLRPIVT